MATTTGLLSWEDFEAFPDDGMHHELIQGEHQIFPPAKSRHTLIAARRKESLLPLKARGLGVVLPEECEVFVHRPNRSVQELRASDTLVLPDLLTDWQLPVAKIFED